MDRNEALSALDAVGETDRKMAERMRWPLWYHASFGLAEGLIVTGLSSEDPGTTAVAAGVAMIGLLGWQTRKSGIFVSGLKGQRTRPLTWAIVTFLLAAIGVGFAVVRGHPDETMLAVGLGAFVTLVLTLASMWWERIYRREVREGDAR